MPARAAASRPDGDGNCRPGRASPAAWPPRDDWRREVNSARRGPSAPRPLPPGRSGAGSRPAPSSAGVTAPASGKPLRRRRQSKQHRRGAGAPGRRRHSGRPGWLAAPSRSLPPASAVPALLPALPPRRRVPCPSPQGRRPAEPPQPPAVGPASCGKPRGPPRATARAAPHHRTRQNRAAPPARATLQIPP